MILGLSPSLFPQEVYLLQVMLFSCSVFPRHGFRIGNRARMRLQSQERSHPKTQVFGCAYIRDVIPDRMGELVPQPEELVSQKNSKVMTLTPQVVLQ